LVLTEAFACNFCRHILTADLLNQRVQVVDSNQPLVWQWTGQRWRSCHQPAAALTPLVWITAGLLLFAPAGLVAGASYLFPPLDPTPGWSFGAVWAIATLALHLLLVLWLLAEHYQLPLYVATKVRIQRQRQREREAG
jgi:hypothetical protein